MSAEDTKLVRPLNVNEPSASERIKGSISRMMDTARQRYSGAAKFPDGSLPVKYFNNIKGVEEYKLRQDVAKEVGKNLEDGGNVQAVYQLGERDVALYKEEQEAKQLAEFDAWFLEKMARVDVNKKQYMQSLYPELIQRKTEQLESEVEMLVRSRLLQEYGASSLEDYTMQFMMEKGLIDTPVLPKPGEGDGGIAKFNRAVNVKDDETANLGPGGVYYDARTHQLRDDTNKHLYVPGILTRLMSGNLGKTVTRPSYNFQEANRVLMLNEVGRLLKEERDKIIAWGRDARKLLEAAQDALRDDSQWGEAVYDLLAALGAIQDSVKTRTNLKEIAEAVTTGLDTDRSRILSTINTLLSLYKSWDAEFDSGSSGSSSTSSSQRRLPRYNDVAERLGGESSSLGSMKTEEPYFAFGEPKFGMKK